MLKKRIEIEFALPGRVRKINLKKDTSGKVENQAAHEELQLPSV